MWNKDSMEEVLNAYSEDEIEAEANMLYKNKCEVINNKTYLILKKDYKIPYTTLIPYKSLYGKLLKSRLQDNINGLDELDKELNKQVNENKGCIKTLDGRLLYAKDTSSKLNYLLQSSNAIYTKQWVMILIKLALKHDMELVKDFLPLGIIHDQIVLQILPQHIELFDKIIEHSLKLINKHYNLRFGIECDTEYVDALTGH
jgi:hypothetical protein